MQARMLHQLMCNVKDSKQYHAAHLFPIPVSVPVPPSVNTLSLSLSSYLSEKNATLDIVFNVNVARLMLKLVKLGFLIETA